MGRAQGERGREEGRGVRLWCDRPVAVSVAVPGDGGRREVGRFEDPAPPPLFFGHHHHRWVEYSGQRIDGYQLIAYLSDAKAFSVELDLVPPPSS